MEDGGWTMEDGGWTMDDGRWTMDDGRWRLIWAIAALALGNLGGGFAVGFNEVLRIVWRIWFRLGCSAGRRFRVGGPRRAPRRWRLQSCNL